MANNFKTHFENLLESKDLGTINRLLDGLRIIVGDFVHKELVETYVCCLQALQQFVPDFNEANVAGCTTPFVKIETEKAEDDNKKKCEIPEWLNQQKGSISAATCCIYTCILCLLRLISDEFAENRNIDPTAALSLFSLTVDFAYYLIKKSDPRSLLSGRAIHRVSVFLGFFNESDGIRNVEGVPFPAKSILLNLLREAISRGVSEWAVTILNAVAAVLLDVEKNPEIVLKLHQLPLIEKLELKHVSNSQIALLLFYKGMAYAQTCVSDLVAPEWIPTGYRIATDCFEKVLAYTDKSISRAGVKEESQGSTPASTSVDAKNQTDNNSKKHQEDYKFFLTRGIYEFRKISHKYLILCRLQSGIISAVSDLSEFLGEDDVVPYQILLIMADSDNRFRHLEAVKAEYSSQFAADGLEKLIILSTNTIAKIGIKKISRAFTKIYLNNVAERVGITPEEALTVIQDMIADNSINAKLTWTKEGSSNDAIIEFCAELPLYGTTIPREQAHTLIEKAKELRKAAANAMKFKVKEHQTEKIITDKNDMDVLEELSQFFEFGDF